jgi:hypothetical protein
MNSEDTTTSESQHKDKEELPTLPSETSDDGSTKSTREKKVVVVKPTETDLKASDVPGSSEEVKKEDNNDKEQKQQPL